MIKKILLLMRRNSMTLLGAAVLASGIFYVVNNPNLFMSSILSLQEKEFIAEKWRDVAYKTNDGYVDIFLAETLQTPENINFIIDFDDDNIEINAENLSGQGTWTRTRIDKNTIHIESFPNKDIKKEESLIMLPFSGDMRDILLSEALATYPKNKKQYLSIGSLNELSGHSGNSE